MTVGDEVNWEALLVGIDGLEDLHFVSGDSDYVSPINTEKMNNFLVSEWKEVKSSEIFYYKKLSEFFSLNFPKIQLASDVENALLIEKLSMSGSFTTTHTIISKLSEVSDFSISQVEDLIDIANLNNQVGWIIHDDDLYMFYSNIRDKYGEEISPSSLDVLNSLLSLEEYF